MPYERRAGVKQRLHISATQYGADAKAAIAVIVSAMG
jgi:hypothetical protein